MKKFESRPLRRLSALSAVLSLAVLTGSAWGQEIHTVPPPGAPPASELVDHVPVITEQGVLGEILDPRTMGPSWIESMDDVMARHVDDVGPWFNKRGRNGSQGSWEIPGIRTSLRAHSGEHYVTNKFGDTAMGIGFGGPVDLEGVWVAGQAEQVAWTAGLRAVGYREGREVGRTEWFEDIGAAPVWFDVHLAGIDRVVFEALPVLQGGGYYGLDDLTFVEQVDGHASTRVVTFDDLGHKANLTGSTYAGLTWERGTGDFDQADVRRVHEPLDPFGPDDSPVGGQTALMGGSGTAPTLGASFRGTTLGDNGAGFIPPDTCGAVGTNHFVAVTNMNLSVYDKSSGSRLINTSMQNFFNTGGSAGDPRCVFDEHHDRWVIIADDFSSGCFLAYSLTDDATGSWFKTFILFSSGFDANRWPDYPTLGVDQNGIYMAAYMVGSPARMSIFAVDTAPLLQTTPSLGTVSAWRSLPWEGAIQPAVTHGTPTGEYLISRQSSTGLRVRRILPPMTGPTLQELGVASIPSHSSPPPAPAMGSTVPLSTVGHRLMNAEFRNGSIWAAHTIDVGGRAACRWYEVNASAANLIQSGTISDSSLSYFFPGVAVNANDEALIGFTASSPNMFAGAYYAGRVPSDAAGETSAPASMHDGEGPYDLASSGTNRWGDYSLSSVDPTNDTTLWSIQEYARTNNRWGTWIGSFDFGPNCSANNYCTAGTTWNLCNATMSAFGTPSLSNSGPYTLTASNVEGNKQGILFYGVSGQNAAPWGQGSSSFLCVKSPTQRTPAQNSGGSNGNCNGSLSIDWNAYVAANPNKAVNQALLVGTLVQAQAWFRDPPSPKTTSLSDGLEFSVCP